MIPEQGHNDNLELDSQREKKHLHLPVISREDPSVPPRSALKLEMYFLQIYESRKLNSTINSNGLVHIQRY